MELGETLQILEGIIYEKAKKRIGSGGNATITSNGRHGRGSGKIQRRSI